MALSFKVVTIMILVSVTVAEVSKTERIRLQPKGGESLFAAASGTSTTANNVITNATATNGTSTTANIVINTTAQVITCETKPCTSPGTWCKDVDGGRECPCKPGFYASDSTCNPGLIFGGKLFVAAPTTRETVEIFLESVYSNTKGFIDIEVKQKNELKEIDEESWKYELFYSTNSGATTEIISDRLAYYLWTQPMCTTDDKTCDVVFSNGETILVYVKESVDNAGTLSEAVCSSVDGYCDTNSTICKGVDGIATCECVEGYVKKSGADGFCAEIVCRQNSDCNAPFGSCDEYLSENAGKCNCMFGFDGRHCYSPLLFVFIIVAGVLLLTTVILTGLLICRCNATARKTGSTTKRSFEDLYNTEESGWSRHVAGMRAKFPDNYNHNKAYEDDSSDEQPKKNRSKRETTSGVQQPKTGNSRHSRAMHHDPHEYRNY